MATLVREPDKYNHWQQSTIQVAVKKLRFEDPKNQNKNSKVRVMYTFVAFPSPT